MKAKKPLLLAAAILALALVVFTLGGCAEDATQTMAGDTQNTTISLETTTAMPETTTATITSPTTTAPSRPVTTEPYPLETLLPNGHTQGMVFMVQVTGVPGSEYRNINIEYAEMLTGEEAKNAALEAGDIAPGEELPNDYYIRREGLEETEGFGTGHLVSPTVSITTATYGDGGERSITWEEFVSFFLSPSPPEGAEHMRGVPWIIERDRDGTVVSMAEQPLP
ncbi:MAG: hypothetical protein V1912_12775 [bacterium]